MASTYTVKAGDTLNGIATGMGFSNYKEAGITGYGANPDLIKVGQILTIGGTPKSAATTPPPADPNQVKDLSTANSFINSGQQSDFQSATAATQPPVRTSASNYSDIFDSLKKSLTSDLPSKPSAPNLTDTFTNLRNSYGITDLESNLTELQKQARDIQALNQVQYDAETGKPVALNVIEGRVSEEQKQNNQKLTAINNSISTITAQLTSKYNVIDSIMKYTDADYDNATGEYDKQFSQNLSLMNMAKGIADTEQSREDRAKDDARANLQIIYNNMPSDVTKLSSAEQANITKLELQAGLPSGFYASIAAKNPKSDILSTTTRESGGKKYADVILRNDDGSLTTKTITLGGVDPSSSTGNKGEVFSSITTILSNKNSTTKAGDPVLDSNGKLTPAGFKAIVDFAATASPSVGRADIISQYSGYLAEEGVNYGLTAKEKSDLGIY